MMLVTMITILIIILAVSHYRDHHHHHDLHLTAVILELWSSRVVRNP